MFALAGIGAGFAGFADRSDEENVTVQHLVKYVGGMRQRSWLSAQSMVLGHASPAFVCLHTLAELEARVWTPMLAASPCRRL